MAHIGIMENQRTRQSTNQFEAGQVEADSWQYPGSVVFM